MAEMLLQVGELDNDGMDDEDETELVELDKGDYACDTTKMYVAIFDGPNCLKKNKNKEASNQANKWIKRRSYEFDGECHAHNKNNESVRYRCHDTKLVMKQWTGTTCSPKKNRIEKQVHVFGKCYEEEGHSVKVWYKGRNQKKSNYRGKK